MGADDGLSSGARDTSETPRAGGAATTGATPTTASACETGSSWTAQNDFAFDRSTGGDFAGTMSDLIRKSGAAPIAVSSYVDPACHWMVAFSAPDAAGEVRHATTFTPMLRHPAGLWTAAPQAQGWLRVLDRSARAVWIPFVDATGSASYGEASCASLTEVRVTAVIPPSAGDIAVETSTGVRTVRELMGSEAPARGWDVRFVFSATTAR